MFTPESRATLRSDIISFAARDARIAAAADFTALMNTTYRALHHLDVRAGAWIYRVFLLPETLQVDLAFVPAAEFRALAPTFRLLYGDARQPAHAGAPSAGDLIGLAWLHALHARTSLARAKLWQAESMLAGLRNHTRALACLRHRLPTAHARGVDQLPQALLAAFAASVIHALDPTELSRAFAAAVPLLLRESQAVDAQLAAHLHHPLTSLTELSCAS